MELVGVASDGAEAVTLVREMQPDVVLMDINMPGMSGIEATRIIHGEHPDVSVIGLSMFEEGEQAEAMRAAGAAAYVTKSSGSDAITAAIRASYRGRTRLGPTERQAAIGSAIPHRGFPGQIEPIEAPSPEPVLRRPLRSPRCSGHRSSIGPAVAAACR